MKFISTKGKSDPVTFSEALRSGLASDGGLYVAQSLPQFSTHEMLACENLIDFAKLILKPFLAGDILDNKLDLIVKDAFNFPVPLKYLKNKTAVLEIFHGPTCAFKDVGARFLAGCASHLKDSNAKETVLVATSGDTGGAVASAFYKMANLQVIILYPKNRISQRQEKQLNAWGENIKSFAVKGTFDDCQRLVKQILTSSKWKNNKFVSANSINIGRLLPQTTYYAKASIQYQKQYGAPAGFIVPTGNLGNAVAAVMAMKMGFPIREIVLATNENHAIADYFSSGVWQAQPTIATLANAMDVGSPNNMERLQYFFSDFKEMKENISTVLVTDNDISETIKSGLKNWGEVWCPHTATAVKAREIKGSNDWVVVSTAHPAKFETIVEPLIGQKVDVPDSLAWLLKRPSQVIELEPTIDALEVILKQTCFSA